MTHLALYRTQVSGQVDHLRDSALEEAITHLDLRDTRVEGTLLGFKAMKNLTRLLAAKTNVSGPLNDLEHLKKLERLDLSHTNVQFPYSSRETQLDGGEGKERFKRLISLDLSYVPLNMTVHDFLHPFLMNRGLATLKASNANLRGFLSLETTLVPYVVKKKSKDGETKYQENEKVANEMPLTKSLSVLQLHDNQIEGVRDILPPEALSLLDLSSNPHLGTIKASFVDHLSAVGGKIKLMNCTNLSMEESFQVDGPSSSAVNPWERSNVTEHEDGDKGFFCYGLKDKPGVLISPQYFAPKYLCACSEGFRGTGTECEECGEQ